MKTLILILLLGIACPINSQEKAIQQDSLSVSTFYEYDNRLQIKMNHGFFRWSKDSLLLRKDVKNRSIIAIKTTDKKWSVVVIEKKQFNNEK